MADDARSKYAVHFYGNDYGFLVRGTLDPFEALRFAVEEDEDCRIGGYYTTPDWDEINLADVQILADTLHGLIRAARPGLYRMRPASEAERDDENVSWWTVYAERPGRGTFEGVEFGG